MCPRLHHIRRGIPPEGSGQARTGRLRPGRNDQRRVLLVRPRLHLPPGLAYQAKVPVAKASSELGQFRTTEHVQIQIPQQEALPGTAMAPEQKTC